MMLEAGGSGLGDQGLGFYRWILIKIKPKTALRYMRSWKQQIQKPVAKGGIEATLNARTSYCSQQILRMENMT